MSYVVNAIKPRPTRFANLSYAQIAPGLWQHVSDDGAQVGPQYKTKAELFGDTYRFAHDVYCSGEARA